MDPYNSADAQPPKQPPALPPMNPYAAPTARIADMRDDDLLVKSSRGARLGAVLLDGVIPGAVAIVFAVMLPAFGSDVDGGLTMGGGVLVTLFVLGLIAFAAMQLILLYRHGQTIGKKLVGIRIVRADGSRAGFARLLLLRSFVPGLIGAIPLLGPLFSLVDMLFIFGEEKRCVHDLIADTIVVDA